MYWNAVHLEKQAKERKLREGSEERPVNTSRGSSFDDFLQEDQSAEKGTYVYNTVQISTARLRKDFDNGVCED